MPAIDKLTSKFQERFKKNVSMKELTSFKTGGDADFVFWPLNADEAIDAVLILNKEKIPATLIGKGTNLLVRDSGIEGVVICTSLMKNMSMNKYEVTASCGTLMSEAAHFAQQHSLAGMEFMSGIPGSVGGGVYMNAGAYGDEIKDIIVSVRAASQTGEIVDFEYDDLKFDYRKSNFSDLDMIILEATFDLLKDDSIRIKDRMKDMNSKRADKQPLNYPSAGSTFKRPEGAYAAKLIEDAGLKGYKIGGAMISDKHAGFIINFDNASSSDIISLIEYVQEKVFEKFSIMLETEVKIVGRA